jgi:lipocalin
VRAIGYNECMPGDAPLSLPPGARMLLRAPDAVTRTIAAADPDRERRWLLRRPLAVRRGFVEQVIDCGAGAAVQRRWMLEQDDAVRASYVAEVLERARRPDREAIWLLSQNAAVRASYVAQVLDEAD